MTDRQTILIVDDKEQNLYALEKILENAGADTVRATNGNDALIACLNHEFALAILDVQMPGMDGYELAGLIREDERTKNLPVIFMTAVYSDEYHMFKGYRAGAVDFVTKPYKPEILLTKVRIFLQLDHQRRELEKTIELEKAKNHLENILLSLTDAVLVVSKNGIVQSVNDAALSLFCYPPGEMIGIPFSGLFEAPGSNIERNLLFSDTSENTAAHTEETTVLTKQGKSIPVLISGSPFHDRENLLLGSVIVAKDIRERIQARKALEASENLFKTIIKSNADAIVVTVEDVICFANPAAEKLFDRPVSELLGQNIGFPVLEKGSSDVQIHHPSGDHVTAVMRSIKIEWEGAAAHLISLHDITERINAEEEVLKARKLESLGTLAGGIAHDLNNLLFAVMGNISLAQDDLKPETGTFESLKEAEKACIKAKELSARLITFSKGGDPVKKMMSIDDLLKDTVISALSGSVIKPKISIADAIRKVNIDEGQIKQVVRNIVANAKEAMDDKGQLTVSCENIDIAEEGYLTLSQGEYIKISFKDHGCGISKENFEKIFDPYFSTKDMGADKGQGLGLTVSYSIIQKHGGLITVESKLETGSNFSVYLPALSIKEPDLQKAEEKPAAQKPVKQPATGTGKILLMDDEEAIRIFLSRVLNRLGYDVENCTEGKEAIEIYKTAMESKEPFDVVILDLTNKIGMGGQETMKRLLEIDHNAKGIVITGYSDDPVVANFRVYGFSGSLTKPTTRDELCKVINEVVSRGK